MNRLYLVSTVRCLACGAVYPKPTPVLTAEVNPGCPRCGYVGWAAVDENEDEEVMEEPASLRSAADRTRLRFWRAG